MERFDLMGLDNVVLSSGMKTVLVPFGTMEQDSDGTATIKIDKELQPGSILKAIKKN